MVERRIPMRQCVGCHTRQPKGTLLRIAMMQGRLTVDSRGRLPGRGAYVHDLAECLDRATKRGGLARALRVPVSIDPASIAELRRQVTGILADTGPGSGPRQARGRSSQDMEVQPSRGLTRPEPRFVVGTPQVQVKDQ